jgi:predicted RNA-binding protein with TRAM domain
VLLLDQVKPVPPVKLTVVEPTHTCEGPATVGIGFTVIVDEVLEQPVAVLVKVNEVEPTASPVTTPLGEIVATAGFPPDQVPPVDGVKLIFAPTHTCVGPPKTGSAFIKTADVVSEHPVEVSKKLNVTLPGFTGDTGVIIPVVLPTVARFVANDVHVPPVVGERVPVLPTQTEAGEVKTGCGLTVTTEVVLEQVVVELVNIN